MTEQQMKSISVEDLFSSGKISKKTYNTLVRARMRTAFDLKRYESGLSRLFRAGTSGMREISILLAEFSQTDNLPMSASLFPEFEPQVSDGEQLMASLSPKETQLLEVAYKNVLRKLQSIHERTSTKIANVLFSIPISIFVRDYLLEEDERILMLNEVGEATMQQVAQVKDVIKNELQLVREKQVPVEYRLYYYQISLGERSTLIWRKSKSLPSPSPHIPTPSLMRFSTRMGRQNLWAVSSSDCSLIRKTAPIWRMSSMMSLSPLTMRAYHS